MYAVCTDDKPKNSCHLVKVYTTEIWTAIAFVHNCIEHEQELEFGVNA
jgi:hypothetical protein